MADNTRGSPTIMNIQRRSKKVKNLEKEVELILSQDENEDDVHTEEQHLPKTPSTSGNMKDACTPESSVLRDMQQTPRRSCRKSVKPPQDYDDIIVRKSLRSMSRSAKKELVSLSEENVENVDNLEDQHKWSAAKVGRSSSKRTRKSKRITKGKRIMDEDTTVDDHAGENDDQIEANNEGDREIAEIPRETDMENDKKIDIVENKMDITLIKSEEVMIENLQDEVIVVEEIMPLKKEVVDQEQPEGDEPLKNAYTTIETKEGADEAQQLVGEETIPAQPSESVCSTTQNKEILHVEHPEEEIYLIQNDSEESNEFPDQVADEKEKLDSKIAKSITNTNEDNENSFGCYLKSKEINIEDLGLNPINDEDEADNEPKEDIKKVVVGCQESEEMPSLIVCDDEEDGEVPKEQNQDEKAQLNATFDAEDSVVLVVEEASNSSTAETLEMDTLRMSDEESQNSQGSSAKKAPRIMLTTTEEQNQTLLSTPKQSVKHYRFPTPYRNGSDSKLKKENVGSANKKLPIGGNVSLNTNTSFTTMAPRDIVLRGIRKRSLSVCLGSEDVDATHLTRSAKRRKALSRRAPGVQKMVNFYSPANQTAIIEDLDTLIAKSVKKIDSGIKRNQNVTTRRKRSLSLDESIMSKSLNISKLPRPVSNQTSFLNTTTTNSVSSSSSSTSKTTRTKLPNFAAIHQKQFQKMENLIDHVTRKQERSKVLINSATKIRSASAQKNITMNVANKNTQNEKPKALKRIDMASTSQSQTINRSIMNNSGTSRKINAVQSNTTDGNKTTSKLPDPRNMKQVINLQTANKPKSAPTQLLPKKHLKPTQSFNVSSLSHSMANSTLKQKPMFSLSTHIGDRSTTTTSSLANTSTVNRQLSTQDKMASRLQRHMDLFKGRVPATRAGVDSRKTEAGIRGVRSNRRFELQMQHRKHLEN